MFASCNATQGDIYRNLYLEGLLTLLASLPTPRSPQLLASKTVGSACSATRAWTSPTRHEALDRAGAEQGRLSGTKSHASLTSVNFLVPAPLIISTNRRRWESGP